MCKQASGVEVCGRWSAGPASVPATSSPDRASGLTANAPGALGDQVTNGPITPGFAVRSGCAARVGLACSERAASVQNGGEASVQQM